MKTLRLIILVLSFCLNSYTHYGWCLENKVAILGESYNFEDHNTGINEEILKRLFILIKAANPSAVIFTGNMSTEVQPNEGKSTFNDFLQTNIQSNQGTFAKRLNSFIALKDATLGNSIPFYPLIARQEAPTPKALDIFLSTFKVKNDPSSGSPLAYTVAIDNAFFVILSLAYYDPNLQTTVEHYVSPTLLRWLSATLKSAKKHFDFFFVVGNEPAFSTTASTSNFKGIDYDRGRRDAFWKILVENHVSAYFCSNEHLYDRSNRDGVWQIISGGAGAWLYSREFDKAFYHYLMMTIPPSLEKSPQVNVYDAQANLVDSFELKPTQYPVYQLRISGR